jgi:hypothetical protein
VRIPPPESQTPEMLEKKYGNLNWVMARAPKTLRLSAYASKNRPPMGNQVPAIRANSGHAIPEHFMNISLDF